MDTKEKLKKIVKALDSKKAEDIEVLGIRDLTVLSDYFVIANGTSTTHTRTLADEVEYQMSEEGIEPSGKEGHNGSNWIVLDYSDVIVQCSTRKQESSTSSKDFGLTVSILTWKNY